MSDVESLDVHALAGFESRACPGREVIEFVPLFSHCFQCFLFLSMSGQWILTSQSGWIIYFCILKYANITETCQRSPLTPEVQMWSWSCGLNGDRVEPLREAPIDWFTIITDWFSGICAELAVSKRADQKIWSDGRFIYYLVLFLSLHLLFC